MLIKPQISNINIFNLDNYQALSSIYLYLKNPNFNYKQDNENVYKIYNKNLVAFRDNKLNVLKLFRNYTLMDFYTDEFLELSSLKGFDKKLVFFEENNIYLHSDFKKLIYDYLVFLLQKNIEYFKNNICKLDFNFNQNNIKKVLYIPKERYLVWLATYSNNENFNIVFNFLSKVSDHIFRRCIDEIYKIEIIEVNIFEINNRLKRIENLKFSNINNHIKF